MTSGDARRLPADTAARLGAEAEGYLMARTHWTEAGREAQNLCAALPWLTAAQTEELTRHYIAHRIAVSRRMLAATVQRADELRREYEERYEQLRRGLIRRHAVWACCLLGCAAGIGSLSVAVAR